MRRAARTDSVDDDNCRILYTAPGNGTANGLCGVPGREPPTAWDNAGTNPAALTLAAMTQEPGAIG
jgi:hypothetical protein